MFQRKRTTPLVNAAVALSLLAVVPPITLAEQSEVTINYEKFVLDNGLTLLVHEDHKAPIVAVNVWYHVGSKNEKAGRTGFAHLFEHLMFNGSENFDDDYFQGAAVIGATDLNGTTSEDRTNYFQNVPTSALDTILWLESDRMGHLLGAITQEKLDEQRGVVQNEKREFENQPYNVSYQLITDNVYPKGHPYSWSVIGSMEDLNAAALDDVHEWFKTYYGTANATVVIAGNVTPEVAKQKVEKYFGDMPAGPPIARHERWIAKRTGEIRQTVQDRVSVPRIIKVWNVPEWGSLPHDHLELLASVLASGKTSRLFKRLVYDDQIASVVEAVVDSREIGSLFVIEVTAQDGVDLARVEKAIDEELARLIDEGPTMEEVERARTGYIADFIRGSERIGGFGGKSDILARNQVYAGDPEHYKTTLSRISSATPADLRKVGNDWLTDGVYALEIHPFPKFEASDAVADRSKLPETDEPPTAAFAKLERTTLDNGLTVVLAERHATPIVNLELLVDAGYAADQFAVPGTAKLTVGMLDEGTTSRSALEISDQLQMLGAELGTGSNLDVSTISVSSLASKLEATLGIFADVILNPSFPDREFDRLKKQQLATIKQEKTRPIQMALRVFPALLYGEEHAYGTPLTGSGDLDSVASIKRDDLVRFHKSWFKPSNATLVVVGDTSMAELKPRLEALLGDWKDGNTPQKNIAKVDHKKASEIYIVDKPGALQSIIFAGHVAPSRGRPGDIALETMNTILGGSFIARLNMNLREDKHWSYGAFTFMVDAKGQRPFIAYAAVQTDKTSESMKEIQKELADIGGSRPVTMVELNKIKEKLIMELPGSWETNAAVSDSINDMIRYNLDSDYFDTFAGKVRALSLDDVTAQAEMVVKPHNLVWVIVGDKEKIAVGIEELGLGTYRSLDADGNLVN